MKTKFTILAILFPFLMVAFAAVVKAEEIPMLSDIVSNVAKATLPSKNYSATVHQTVSQASAVASPAITSFAVSTNEIEEADFTVSGETSGALRVTKATSLKRMTQSTNVNSTAVAPAQNLRLMITVNPMNTLRHIEKLSSATITNDIYQGIPCYKISATDGRFGFVVWVSKATSSVCHQIILEDSNALLETDFEYKKWNGFLVPSHTVITKPSNGTRVDQEFSGHAY
jgi:hypothetical protein